MPLKVIRELLHLYGIFVIYVLILDCANPISAVIATILYWHRGGNWERPIIKTNELMYDAQTVIQLVLLALLGYLLLTICEKLEAYIKDRNGSDIECSSTGFSQTAQTESGDGNGLIH